jgi:hypothetical protein
LVLVSAWVKSEPGEERREGQDLGGVFVRGWVGFVEEVLWVVTVAAPPEFAPGLAGRRPRNLRGCE